MVSESAGHRRAAHPPEEVIMHVVKKFSVAAGALLCSFALTLGSAPLPAGASIAQSKVVSENPADFTPNIVLGTGGQTVYSFAQIGSTMYAGGRFTQVQNAARTITYARQNFVAFDVNNGAVKSVPLSFDGIVQAL